MVNKELFAVMQDDEFEKILNADQVLDELERSKYNRQDEYFQFLNVTGNLFKICGIHVQPLTPAIWCFLWILENGYTLRTKPVTNEDTDMFLYIISHGIKNIGNSLTELYFDSKEYCSQNNIAYDEAQIDIKTTIGLTFKPLEMVPNLSSTEHLEENVFDVDWLTRICSIVAEETNYTPEYIMFQMSLNSCYYYYVNHLRKNDTKNLIRKRTSGEINQAIYERTVELAQQYYEANYEVK